MVGYGARPDFGHRAPKLRGSDPPPESPQELIPGPRLAIGPPACNLHPMCGRYASYLPPDAIGELFRAAGRPNIAPSSNVAPAQSAAVIRRHPDTGEVRLDTLQWGLVPHFTKDLKAARKPINARSETAATSGMFRAALQARRCLVPTDALYESRAQQDGRQPCGIARRDGAPLAFACEQASARNPGMAWKINLLWRRSASESRAESHRSAKQRRRRA